ncbi:MAG TPA: hypothetical protein PKE64_02405 [Anaerolineae bacterium]|mgnify:CR=1 FL=1|nr:hypothetical protein [Anaerolineae bacterium]HMR62839.1 hypothetical protein [Anaerolineae bacterium]
MPKQKNQAELMQRIKQVPYFLEGMPVPPLKQAAPAEPTHPVQISPLVLVAHLGQSSSDHRRLPSTSV